MNFKFILFFVLLTFSQFVVAKEAEQEPCEKYSAPYIASNTFVSCSVSDFGKALTADYQPWITGAPTANVSQVRTQDGKKIYKNALDAYSGVRNVNLLSNCTSDTKLSDGSSLGCDSLVHRDEQTGEVIHESGMTLLKQIQIAVHGEFNDPALEDIIFDPSDPYAQRHRTLSSMNQPRPGADPAEGSCMVWSAWSQDEEVVKMLDSVKDGIFCSGVGFTKGQLKELITMVYPDPTRHIASNDIKSFSHYYSPKGTIVGPADAETANIVLAKLGQLGAGSDLTPDKLVQLAAETKKSGAKLIMDLYPGTVDIWNQPVESVVDVASFDKNYTIETQNDYLSSKDLSNITGGADLKSMLARAEAQLTGNALQADGGSPEPALAELQRAAGEPVRAIYGLNNQFAELKKLQLSLIQQNKVGLGNTQVTKHHIFINYASEGAFAQNGEKINDVTGEKLHRTRELEYVSVNGRPGTWLPPTTKKLSEVCADPEHNMGNRDVRGTGLNNYGLVQYLGSEEYTGSTFNHLTQQCAGLPKNDRDIAIGVFPPKQMKVYRNPNGDARFGAETDKCKMYNAIKQMIEHCEDKHPHAFHQAALFMADLKAVVQKNEVSQADADRLVQNYPKIKDFLDSPADLKQDIDKICAGQSSQVVGLSALYQKLFH